LVVSAAGAASRSRRRWGTRRIVTTAAFAWNRDRLTGGGAVSVQPGSSQAFERSVRIVVHGLERKLKSPTRVESKLPDHMNRNADSCSNPKVKTEEILESGDEILVAPSLPGLKFVAHGDARDGIGSPFPSLRPLGVGRLLDRIREEVNQSTERDPMAREMLLVPLIPSALAILSILDVEVVTKAASGHRPKARRHTRVLQESAGASQNGLVPPLNVSVGFVHVRSRGPVREPEGAESGIQLLRPICVDELQIGSTPEIIERLISLACSFARQGIAISDVGGQVVKRQGRLVH